MANMHRTEPLKTVHLFLQSEILGTLQECSQKTLLETLPGILIGFLLLFLRREKQVRRSNLLR